MAGSAIFERLALNAPHLTSKQFIPAFVYGTAWKKEATSDLVYQALCNGFTGVDTACQPKHYREDLVGAGLRRALSEGKIRRDSIFVQTKYTSLSGHDPNEIPYNSESTIAEQVVASVEVSLQHLRQIDDASDAANKNSYLDALVLHSPLPTIEATLEAWRTLEQYVPDKIRNLGISNCNLFTLMELYERVNIKPAVVQNRFHSSTKFDIGIRKFCREKSIIYQSFWTLTANPGLVYSAEAGQLASQLRISPQASLYSLVLALGDTVVLNGTKNVRTMQEDHAALSKVRQYATNNVGEWKQLLSDFRKLLGEPNP